MAQAAQGRHPQRFAALSLLQAARVAQQPVQGVLVALEAGRLMVLAELAAPPAAQLRQQAAAADGAALEALVLLPPPAGAGGG